MADKLEITRIDFVETSNSVIVNKLAIVNGKWLVVSHQTKAKGDDDFDLEEAIEWCRQNWNTVRRWPGGARAWKYALTPIRTAEQIKALRARLQRQPDPRLNGTLHTLDLAFDYA